VKKRRVVLAVALQRGGGNPGDLYRFLLSQGGVWTPAGVYPDANRGRSDSFSGIVLGSF